MSRLLEVSRSGYYKWHKVQAVRLRGENQRQRFLDQLDRKIHDIWEDSDEVYGAPRITAELAEDGVYANRKTVAKRMRMMGIEGISPRAFVPVTTIQSKRKSTLPDPVKRLFDQGHGVSRFSSAMQLKPTTERTGGVFGDPKSSSSGTIAHALLK